MAPKVEQRLSGLPTSVISAVDVGRLIRELEHVNEVLSQAELRKPGARFEAPHVTQLLGKTVQLNKLDLSDASDRAKLLAFLTNIKTDAPKLHISFNVDPSLNVMEKLVTWLRREIHPLILVTTGLQPTIGAGCVIRSTNKQFDLSLRQSFSNKHDMLMRALSPPPEVQAVVPAPAEVAA